ncbi:hypothetical protein BC834DRAFT_373241 [Gloeopeniophorella convolvens]|nr:hypothetical protein BC834DRAFT_373241 [Gloeopeniophorella convolvens]
MPTHSENKGAVKLERCELDDNQHIACENVLSVEFIERNIEAAIFNLVNLRYQRNSLLPVSKMAPETLTLVFHFLSREWRPGYKDHRLGWIVASHVCRHWRQIALSAPTLWVVSIFGLGSHWLEEGITRARAASLDIDPPEGVIPTSNDWVTIINNLHRCSSVRLADLPVDCSDHVRRLLATPAPVLRNLFLATAKDRTMDLHNPPVDLMMFDGSAPNLRRITLHHTHFPWALFPCNSLSSLVINWSECQTSDVYSVSEWDNLMAILSASRSLRVLDLSHCLPTPSYHQSPQYRTVHLPDLADLRLNGPGMSFVVRIINALVIPPSTKLSLNCSYDQPGNTVPCIVIPVVAAHFGSPGSSILRSLCIFEYPDDPVSMGIAARSDVASMSSFFEDGNFFDIDNDVVVHDSSISFSGSVNSESGSDDIPFDYQDVLRCVFSMFPLAQLGYLYLDVPPTTTLKPVDWSTYLRHCSNVCEVDIVGSNAGSFFTALVSQINPSSLDNRYAKSTALNGHIPPLLPQLATLFIRKVDFTVGGRSSGSPYNNLLTVLEQRIRLGTPLANVGVWVCKFGSKREKRISKIREVFPHFEEDGEEPCE